MLTADAVLYTTEGPVVDRTANHLATAHITWQVKEWALVRTRQ
jgi:hypothetical protein